MESDEADREGLRQAHRDMIEAMLARDVERLETLLDTGYVLVHMTGYRQPRAEWLSEVASGAMRYHRAREHSIGVEVAGDRAEVVGRDVVEATIHGFHGTWNLQLVTGYVRRGGAWLATGTVASIY